MRTPLDTTDMIQTVTYERLYDVRRAMVPHSLLGGESDEIAERWLVAWEARRPGSQIPTIGPLAAQSSADGPEADGRIWVIPEKVRPSSSFHEVVAGVRLRIDEWAGPRTHRGNVRTGVAAGVPRRGRASIPSNARHGDRRRSRSPSELLVRRPKSAAVELLGQPPGGLDGQALAALAERRPSQIAQPAPGGRLRRAAVSSRIPADGLRPAPER